MAPVDSRPFSLSAVAMFARTRLPAPVRRVARLMRHVFERPIPSPAVPQELLSDCRVCATRIDLVATLPSGGRVAEVGTLVGDFAREILHRNAPAELHLIDLDLSRVAADVRGDPRTRLHGGPSVEILERFPYDFFDWVYIDADHSYVAVKRDAETAARKVRPGGFLVFNDFAQIDPDLGVYGVHRAVCEFAVEHKWRFARLSYDNFALYDVALQRPDDWAGHDGR